MPAEFLSTSDQRSASLVQIRCDDPSSLGPAEALSRSDECAARICSDVLGVQEASCEQSLCHFGVKRKDLAQSESLRHPTRTQQVSAETNKHSCCVNGVFRTSNKCSDEQILMFYKESRSDIQRLQIKHLQSQLEHTKDLSQSARPLRSEAGSHASQRFETCPASREEGLLSMRKIDFGRASTRPIGETRAANTQKVGDAKSHRCSSNKCCTPRQQEALCPFARSL